ncbi:hypothetical protein MMC10_006040 [Thelotrema lepadinum]|nr:hypothetical protein [Thelotrema lepadinum]
MDAAAPPAPAKPYADDTQAEPHPSTQDNLNASAAKVADEDKKDDKENSKDGGTAPDSSGMSHAGAGSDLDALEYPSMNLSFDAPSTGSAKFVTCSNIRAGDCVSD